MANCNIPPRTQESETIPRITRSNHGNLIDFSGNDQAIGVGQKRTDLTGRAFGAWTVTAEAPCEISPMGDKVRMWHCVCACGYKARVRDKSLTSGRSQSCGCVKAELARQRGADLTGMSFHRWFVIDRAPDRVTDAGRSVKQWRCRCRCGKERFVTPGPLLNGKSRSCGCLKADLLRRRAKRSVPERKREAPTSPPKIDLTGRQFDRWSVVEQAMDRRDDRRQKRQLWLCRCRCGVEKEVLSGDLLRGKSRSCGCLRKEVLPEARRLARLRRQVAAVDAAF